MDKNIPVRDVSDYKPNPNIQKIFEVDEGLPENELAFDVLKKLILARKIEDLAFLSIGKMLKIIRDKKLYKTLDFDNFSQFLESDEISYSREKAYLYIRTFELYVEKLSLNPNEVGKMGIARLMMMIPIIKELPRDEAITKLEEMKNVPYNTFVHDIRTVTNTNGKPNIYFSKEFNKWIINYYENITELKSLGIFKNDQPKKIS